MKKTVLITGCSSGFGRMTAETFHRRGWQVVATMRSPKRETELANRDGILVTRLDVTAPESIDTAFTAAIARFGALHAVVNNAGYGGHALFEQASDTAARAMFETNVFGLMNVMRAALPLMRKQGSGAVVNVTSMAGLLGLPFNSIYSASKYAVTGLTEALALEYQPMGVRLCVVEPGAYPTTRFNANMDNQIDSNDAELAEYAKQFGDHFTSLAKQMASQSGTVADPQEVADLIYACATKEMPVHNPVGADANMLVHMMESGSRQAFIDKFAGMVLPPQRRS